MKSLFIIGLNIFAALILMACNSQNDKRLEQTLPFAGENRGELEKVLTHYENNPEKLEAARFLIRNMPRWYGYEGWQLDSIKAVLKQKDLGESVPKETTDFSIPHQSADFLFYHRVGFCREACDVILYAMRACGIPVACEYFVYSPEYQHPHFWTTLRDMTGKYIQFGFNEFEASRTNPGSDGRKKGKVYRYCFGAQEEPFSGITKGEKVPDLFRDRYIKDVTANYFGRNEVSLSVQSGYEEYIYLGVFSPGGWIPIDITDNNKGSVTFRNLEPNVIYQPLVSDGHNHRAAGYPFIYTSEKISILKPDTSNLKKAVVKRKMSICGGYNDFQHRGIIGSQIEASLEKDFSKADLLFRFNDTLRTNYYEIRPTDINKKYRYVRFVSPPDNILELAEFAVFADSTDRGQIKLNRIGNYSWPTSWLDNITDGDILSYFSTGDSSCFVAYDLGKVTPIRKIVFSPRNDDNYVWPGDEYELFYQDGINGWKPLGVQTATGRELEYLVPDNALLWLRDRTKGREEQVFIYKDGKQYFTVDL